MTLHRILDTGLASGSVFDVGAASGALLDSLTITPFVHRQRKGPA